MLSGDEPIFTVRAQDALSVPLLEAYSDICGQFGLDDQVEQVQRRIKQFHHWQDEHRDQTKLPRYSGGMAETMGEVVVAS